MARPGGGKGWVWSVAWADVRDGVSRRPVRLSLKEMIA